MDDRRVLSTATANKLSGLLLIAGLAFLFLQISPLLVAGYQGIDYYCLTTTSNRPIGIVPPDESDPKGYATSWPVTLECRYPAANDGQGRTFYPLPNLAAFAWVGIGLVAGGIGVRASRKLITR